MESSLLQRSPGNDNNAISDALNNSEPCTYYSTHAGAYACSTPKTASVPNGLNPGTNSISEAAYSTTVLDNEPLGTQY
ncbi:MAG: hypothetical protein LBG75_00005, partial [Candidatus Nomurabacteria bacterium]|nr:hypothetical protein [Candidatus Nomurabacteria bacterium]